MQQAERLRIAQEIYSKVFERADTTPGNAVNFLKEFLVKTTQEQGLDLSALDAKKRNPSSTIQSRIEDSTRRLTFGLTAVPPLPEIAALLDSQGFSHPDTDRKVGDIARVRVTSHNAVEEQKTKISELQHQGRLREQLYSNGREISR